MKVVLREVSKGKDGQALPPTSLEFHTGQVRYALAETEQRPTVLGLIASGRMRPDTGDVTLDGNASTKQLRRQVALVDAPDVSDPHADISLAGVVAEELMFAGLGATPLHARRWLSRLGYSELASVAIGNIDPAARVRILCELAVLRDGVEAIVLVSPDRHGGSPDGWWRIGREFADRGFALLVIVGGSAAVALERMQELGAVNASGPVDLDADALRLASRILSEERSDALRLASLAQGPVPGAHTSGADTPDDGPDAAQHPTSVNPSDGAPADARRLASRILSEERSDALRLASLAQEPTKGAQEPMEGVQEPMEGAQEPTEHSQEHGKGAQ